VAIPLAIDSQIGYEPMAADRRFFAPADAQRRDSSKTEVSYHEPFWRADGSGPAGDSLAGFGGPTLTIDACTEGKGHAGSSCLCHHPKGPAARRRGQRAESRPQRRQSCVKLATGSAPKGPVAHRLHEQDWSVESYPWRDDQPRTHRVLTEFGGACVSVRESTGQGTERLGVMCG